MTSRKGPPLTEKLVAEILEAFTPEERHEDGIDGSDWIPVQANLEARAEAAEAELRKLREEFWEMTEKRDDWKDECAKLRAVVEAARVLRRVDNHLPAWRERDDLADAIDALDRPDQKTGTDEPRATRPAQTTSGDLVNDPTWARPSRPADAPCDRPDQKTSGEQLPPLTDELAEKAWTAAARRIIAADEAEQRERPAEGREEPGICERCGGRGMLPGLVTCEGCNGTGKTPPSTRAQSKAEWDAYVEAAVLSSTARSSPPSPVSPSADAAHRETAGEKSSGNRIADSAQGEPGEATMTLSRKTHVFASDRPMTMAEFLEPPEEVNRKKLAVAEARIAELTGLLKRVVITAGDTGAIGITLSRDIREALGREANK